MAKIMVIDSSETSLQTLQEFLQRDGHEFIVCQEAQEFQTALEKTKFDLILIDADFEKMYFQNVIQAVNDSKENSKTNMIVSLSSPHPETLHTLTHHGVSSLFVKPYRYQLFKEKIEIALDPHKYENREFDPFILKLFLESAVYIFERMANIRIQSRKPFLKSDNKNLGGVSAVIELKSAQVKGFMAISVSEEILARCLFQIFGKAVPIDASAIQDICGELCNQITGRAKQQFLKSKRMSFEIGVPTIMSASGHLLDYKSSSPILVIPFVFEGTKAIFVEFCLEINVEETERSPEKMQVVVEDGNFILF